MKLLINEERKQKGITPAKLKHLGSLCIHQQSTEENMLHFASFPSLLFKNKVSRNEETRKLSRLMTFESVLMLFAKNYQN